MTRRKRINLALQGGGAHGAFTWGALDRLLEDESIEIEGVSGASAGAMNAGALLQGHLTGGREGARDALARFWRSVADLAASNPIRRSFLDQFLGNWNLDQAPAYQWAGSLVRLFSPYELNPYNINPLRDFIHANLDAAAIRAADALKLFVSATNARTGELRVFERAEITADVFLASACLPLVFQSVEIDGEPYWDGGYTGNPALFPLVEQCDSGDIVIIQINPMNRHQEPRTAPAILNRLNEITMNASLRHELRLIAAMQDLVSAGRLNGAATSMLRNMHVHVISAEAEMAALGAASKMSGELAFLEHLREIGWRSADSWLKSNSEALGLRSSFDLAGLLRERTLGSTRTPPMSRFSRNGE